MGRGSCRWRAVKERFGFMRIGCCAGPWGIRDGAQARDHMALEIEEAPVSFQESHSIVEERNQGGRGEEMNLAAALAAERQYRVGSAAVEEEAEEEEEQERAVERGFGTPMRVSLMRLLEEGEEGEAAEGAVVEAAGGSCCVCMGRKKGAAFIPCGHTFCRVCSRDLWLNRGSCPLCNRPILEILDIF